MKRIVDITIILGLFLAILFAVLIVWPRYMPWEVNREREKINEQIFLAEEKWAQANSENYNLDVFVNAPAHCLGRKATLQVRSGELVNVIEYDDALGMIDPNNPRIVEDFVHNPCDYSRLLPTTIFERTKRQADGMYISATFDSEYGYVDKFEEHAISRGVPHPFFVLEYSNFVPVDEAER